MEPDMLLHLLVLGMLLDLLQALDLVHQDAALASATRGSAPELVEPDVTSQSTYGTGRRDAPFLSLVWLFTKVRICLSIWLR